jgi:hypothetical protein
MPLLNFIFIVSRVEVCHEQDLDFHYNQMREEGWWPLWIDCNPIWIVNKKIYFTFWVSCLIFPFDLASSVSCSRSPGDSACHWFFHFAPQVLELHPEAPVSVLSVFTALLGSAVRRQLFFRSSFCYRRKTRFRSEQRWAILFSCGTARNQFLASDLSLAQDFKAPVHSSAWVSNCWPFLVSRFDSISVFVSSSWNSSLIWFCLRQA